MEFTTATISPIPKEENRHFSCHYIVHVTIPNNLSLAQLVEHMTVAVTTQISYGRWFDSGS
eukprot:scaffold8015_cov165-Ochromonas_danica.AAC.40